MLYSDAHQESTEEGINVMAQPLRSVTDRKGERNILGLFIQMDTEDSSTPQVSLKPVKLMATLQKSAFW